MRKILLILLAASGITAQAQEKKLVNVEYSLVTINEDQTETLTPQGISGSTNYYDKDNVLFMEQNDYSRLYYTYNADETIATKNYYEWSSATGWTYSAASSYTYEYDGEGNLAQIVSGTGNYTQYTGYQNGEYTKLENFYSSGESYYTADFELTFNEAGQLVQKDQLVGGVLNQRYTYTYNADGKLATQHSAYVAPDGSETSPADYVYYYNADGSVQKYRYTTESRYGSYTYEYVYNYVEMNPAYTVRNVKAESIGNNQVSLSWDAVEGATYNVICDNKTIAVEGTSYTTDPLLDGEHTTYIQSVINSTARNLSEGVTLAVKDPGKLPAENLEILGVEESETSWGDVAYNVSLSFRLPETNSTIVGYTLYYGTETYDCMSIADPVVDGNTVSAAVQLSQYQVATYNYDTYEYELKENVPLSVVITYASGNAEPSNVVSWNFATNEPASAITPVNIGQSVVPVAYYTVDGAKVARPGRGIHIIKYSDGTAKKIFVK